MVRVNTRHELPVESRMPVTTMQMEHKKMRIYSNPIIITSKSQQRERSESLCNRALYIYIQILPLCMRASCKTQKIV